jgi:hypothetical protein
MQPALDLSEIVTDPEFLSSITRYRPSGGFVPGYEGRFRSNYTATALNAIVQPTGNPDKASPSPEGERMASWIMICSKDSIFMVDHTRGSDFVAWNGGMFRVMKVERYEAYGYYAAFAQEYHPATPTVVTT